MQHSIPTYQLNILSNDEGTPDVFMLNQKAETPISTVSIPYRTNYFGVGICISGKAELKADLETYAVEPGCMITMSPQIIKQWHYMSEDFETLTVFFTKSFITTRNNIDPDKFPFFENAARHCFPVADADAKNIIASLRSVELRYGTSHIYRHEILISLINVLLYETASLYESQNTLLTASQNRSQLLAAAFKKLVNAHFSGERNLKFYAEKLFVSPKHLTEILKQVSGKTAGEWIDEAVILEAKVLLRNPALSIAQIADMLQFADQSTFGRFFKNLAGQSPLSYRQSL